MADITTFLPGGAPDNVVPHANEADIMDDLNESTALYFWSGTQAEYDAIINGTLPANHARTLYFVE